jgi:hypothetical protein
VRPPSDPRCTILSQSEPHSEPHRHPHPTSPHPTHSPTSPDLGRLQAQARAHDGGPQGARRHAVLGLPHPQQRQQVRGSGRPGPRPPLQLPGPPSSCSRPVRSLTPCSPLHPAHAPTHPPHPPQGPLHPAAGRARGKPHRGHPQRPPLGGLRPAGEWLDSPSLASPAPTRPRNWASGCWVSVLPYQPPHPYARFASHLVALRSTSLSANPTSPPQPPSGPPTTASSRRAATTTHCSSGTPRTRRRRRCASRSTRRRSRRSRGACLQAVGRGCREGGGVWGAGSRLLAPF